MQRGRGPGACLPSSDVELIGTGFGRTGTLSTKHALERLGFGPCHHMLEAMAHPGQFRHLEAHVRGEPVDWGAAFAGYRSQVDFPGACVWRELLEAFPEAKVLHTVRDPGRWWDSTRATIWEARTAVAPWVRRLVPAVDRAFAVNEALIWEGLFDGRFLDRDHALAVFEARTAEVVATVPADRLLVFEVADGWEPLCAFLDVPVPDEPFPHVNDAAAMGARVRAARVATHGAPWAVGAVAAGVAARRARRRAGGRGGR